jgi:hypothetical protein
MRFVWHCISEDGRQLVVNDFRVSRPVRQLLIEPIMMILAALPH